MVLFMASSSSAPALEIHWRQDTANSCKKRRRLARCGWGTREGRSVMVLGHKMAQRSAPGERRHPLHPVHCRSDPGVPRRSLRAGRDRAGRARERLPPNGCSSSNGAREADEQIEKRTGPTSKRLQWGRCNRSRPTASEHVEGTKPSMSTADLPQSRARVAIMLVEQSGKVYPATTNIRKPASEPGPQRSKRHRGGLFNPPVPGQGKSAGLRDRSRWGARDLIMALS